MKLSFNTWAYSSFPVWVPSYPLDETIKRIARIGYDGIEIGAASPHAYPDYLDKNRRAEIKSVLAENSIELSSMLPAPGGGPGNNVSSPLVEERRQTVEQYKKVVELCSDLGGATVLYVAGWQVFGTEREQAFEWSREALVDVAATASDYGVTLAVEPTSEDSNLIETADHALELMRAADSQNVKVMFDTNHALYRNEVPSDYVYRMGEHLHHVHLAEAGRLAPGQGGCDFVGVIEALKEIGYDRYLAMEVGFSGRDFQPDLVARQSYEYIKPLVG